MISAPELVLDACADLGEGPSWDAHTGTLYWVDIHAGRLHIFDPYDGNDRQIEVGEYLGCVAPRRLGGLILALRTGFALLASPLLLDDNGSLDGLSSEAAKTIQTSDIFPFPLKGEGDRGWGFSSPQEQGVRAILSPEPALPGNRFNDGKCDPTGRFLAGSMDDAEVEATGSLYSVSPDGSVKTLLSGLRISNGLAWSPDAHTFYHIDTPTRLVMAYDYDVVSGTIAAPRHVITVPPELGWPDGMTSDTQGMLWVAMWGGARLTRWDPATGRLLAEIPFPALNISSCCFGGPDLTDLYVTSARKGMSAKQLAKYPLSGGVFRLRTDIPGKPTFEFGG